MSAMNELTPREREVALHVMEGLTSKEIGRRLGISERTAQVHREKVHDKLGVKNAAELAYLLAQGLPKNALGSRKQLLIALHGVCTMQKELAALHDWLRRAVKHLES